MLARPDSGATCRTLAEVEKARLHKYNTGILTRSADQKVVLTYGTIFDSHDTLVEHASYTYGRVNEILWAGEIQTSDHKIEVINETAGIMVRDTPGITRKVSDVKNLMAYHDRYPQLQKIFAQEPTLLKFDPNAAPPDLHLVKGLTEVARFRHDIANQFATFMSLNEFIESDMLDSEMIATLNEAIKAKSNTALELLEIASKYGFKSPELDPATFAKIKATFGDIAREGFSGDMSVNAARFKFLKESAKYYQRSGKDVISILIEDPKS